jgi:prepilin peptidase CpaA
VALDAILVLDSALLVLTLIVVVVCGATDLLRHKIWNLVTLPAMAAGLILNLSFVLIDGRLGLDFFLSSLSGLGVGFGIMFLLFSFGGMGGGDVKLVAALGAMDPYHFGHRYALWLIFYSVLAGGAIAMVLMTVKGRLIRSFCNVFRTIFTFVMPGLRHEPLKREDSLTMPFGLGIALGALWTLILFEIGVLPG